MSVRKSRSLLATAAMLALHGAVCAQSSVTLFGVVDNAVTIGRGSGPGSANRTQLTSSGLSASRLGFRGVEDLGGGLQASFWLESGLLTDDGRGGTTNINNQSAAASTAGGGGLTFGRRSTVSLSGPFGEVRLGRDFTPQFLSLTNFDPFTTNGVGTNQVHVGALALNGPTETRASNGVAYFLPASLGGFYGTAQYYFGENPRNGAPTQDDGTGAGIRLGYAAGPFNVALATAYTRYATGGVHQSNLGGQWKFASATLMGVYQQDSAGLTEGQGWLVGAVVPIGSGDLRASVSRYTTDLPTGVSPRSTKVALGYVHNLSKRTALYGTFARVKNAGGATTAVGGATTSANASSSGMDLGIRHSF